MYQTWAGDMSQKLRALALHSEESILILAPIWLVTTVYSSSRFKHLSLPLWTLDTYVVQRQTYKNELIKLNVYTYLANS